MSSNHSEINVLEFENQSLGDRHIATEIADLLKQKQAEGKMAVLGLATGSSVLGVYKELIRMHKEEGLSFKNAITFNLDEYYPISKDHKQSYHTYMSEKLFSHVDILPENAHLPDGTKTDKNKEVLCKEYEDKIAQAGGIDLQLLGIGRNGHIGFNEPGSSIESETRFIELDSVTRNDAAPAFGGLENTPTHAITMGVASILRAKKIILMAWSTNKASIISKVIKSDPTSDIPATFLKTVANVTFVLDKEAASEIGK